MNLLVLTKISKFALIGSLSAYLSFASKFNPSIRQAFAYIMIGIIAAFLIAVIWEGRDYILNDSTEESLSTLMSGLNNQSSKRQYLLSTKARLEIVIAFVVIIVFALIGAI